MYRSTKGASKARRDQINTEIRNLKELLPISDTDKSRLSYLHIMSLACIYTRKSVFFGPGTLEGALPLISPTELTDFLHSLPGFLIALSSEGKLIYVSENVSEHLGHSLVDLVAQGDSIYDITDSLDHLVLSSNLMFTSPSESERLFRCRFNTSRSVRRQSAGNKLVLIRGRYHQPPSGAYWSSKPVFIAFCAPLDTRPRLFDNHLFLGFFESQHSKDMMFTQLSDSVGYYLGYQKTELIGKSWYNLLHPQDLTHASAQHYRFLSGGSEARVEMIVRLQSKNTQWIWVYMVLQVECAEVPVLCYNYTVSESEAWCLRQQLTEEQEDTLLFPYALPAPPSHQEPVQSPSYLSSPDTVFTPVAGTPTSGVSAQSFDFSGICGLDFAEVPAPTGREEDSQRGLLPAPPQEKEQGGVTGVGRATKLPELLYSDCMFGANSPTPPCTPQLLGPTFTFGGQEPFGQTTTTEIYYPLEPCASLYERLPPSPDSPGNGGCTVMGLPQVPTPLYIHVPSTPEGILTPEASPIKLPASCYFGYLEGMEQTQIDALAKRIGCHLADSRESCLGTEPAPSQDNNAKDIGESRSSSLPAEAPILDFQALKQWRSVDFSMISFGEEDDEDEDVIENILRDLGAPTMERSPPGPSCHQLGGNSGCPADVESNRAGSACNPDACPATDLSPEEQSFLEELTSYETVFETIVSRSPCDGFIDELYQLQSHGHEYFHQDGSGGNTSF
ncbi:neuronal PAS domain-containing protein 4-like [Carcharodon carcharias]|uniref:neuronal PAS domain-containing protein 4-like n=1 Tax=Carcharodon carcharias TaxID=13397 RepID=UPI001B7E22B9|nr:neuronal PAS domain-containing protein 4-like [Carcharodon carcharias]